MNVDQLKNLLKHYHLKPNFTYGQNFLIDDIVLQDIVDAADISEADAVLEIGPGIGNLTRALCERAGFVLSIEKDPKFFPILKSVKKDYPENFRFEIADALEFDFQAELSARGFINPNAGTNVVPRPDPRSGSAFRSAGYKVVANIPYYITGKILQMLMTAKVKPSSIVVLTQKEVARNLAAKAGDLGILAISVQLYGEPKLVQVVQSKSFYPAPKVDSAIVKIDLYDKAKYELADEKRFFKIVKACFAGKRKQIHNTLVNNLHLDKNFVADILRQLKIKPEARPQELTIEQWIDLAGKIQ
ncbi:MAG: 16S rRNA (adenine(1518)-N(6)/adenine(1519)-N(6))-dimethyltransferase RsmA [Candidatus Doudnabacteria bacterium]|nr:16S rRNA (adenine(1518)-N(6)/adenine(1519)-N(6))-dimethyltransferase RsmA [Candidatus Doudnabacteria bacterium]